MSAKSKQFEGAVVVYLTRAYHDWLDDMKLLGYTRKEIVRFALEQMIDMDTKELCGQLLIARQKNAIEQVKRISHERGKEEG